MFSVFTICTENYRDALDFSLPSWLRLSSIENILIYSDFDFKYPSDRVIVLNELPKTKDWLEVVGFKAELLRKLLNTFIDKNISFIDIDCFIAEDLSDVFKNDFDIAATRMNVKNVSANAGVWFLRNNSATKLFAEEWVRLQYKYKEAGKGVIQYAPSYSQLSFSDILHRECKNKTYLKVIPISSETYNNEADVLSDWYKNLTTQKPKILHFKGRRWRDKGIVNTVMNLCKIKTKIAVYTVVIGRVDNIKQIPVKYKDHADYYLFTDQDMEAPGYIVKKVVNNTGNARRESRKYKIRPENYLSGYDYFLYLDGSIELFVSPQYLVEKYLQNHDIAVFPHPWYNCIYREFKVCIDSGRVSPEIAFEQEILYRSEGYPEENGLTENGVILRRNCRKVYDFNKFWQEIYDRYTERDQLSFCYCAWKMGLKYNTFDGQTSNPALLMTNEFKLYKHGK